MPGLCLTGRSDGGGEGSARAGVHGLTVQPSGAVRRTHERAGEDTGEADLLGLVAHLHELLRLDPALDRVVPDGGAEVLGYRDQLAAGAVQVPQRLRDL